MSIHRSKFTLSVPVAILETVIFLTAFRGLISNFFPPIIWIADGVFIIVLLAIVIESGNNKVNQQAGRNAILHHYLWFFSCIVVLLLQIFMGRIEILKDALFSFRNDVIYTLPFLLIIMLDDVPTSLKLYRFFMRCGFCVCLFAIFQYVFRAQLPQSLLTLQVDNVAGFWGSDAVRVNGLMGNSIIFSGFVIILISLLWAEILYSSHKSLEQIIELATAIIANLLTFSRASIVGMIGILAFEYIVSIPKGTILNILKRSWILFIVGVIGLYIVLTRFNDAIIVQRLLNANQLWNVGSDQVHTSSVSHAIEVIANHFWLGYGVGKVGYASSLGSSAVIRDGAFWAYLLEWGGFVCIIFWSLALRTMIVGFECKKKERHITKAIGLGYLAANIYLITASFINSAYSARSVLVFVWIVGGIVYVLYNEPTKEPAISIT